MNIIIGNTIAFIAAIIMIYSGFLLKKDKIVLTQIIQMMLLTISNIILGGATGAINNTIGCIRNWFCYRNKLTLSLKILIIVVTIILSLGFNNLGVIGLLPVISNVLYTALMDTKNVVYFKL